MEFCHMPLLQLWCNHYHLAALPFLGAVGELLFLLKNNCLSEDSHSFPAEV